MIIAESARINIKDQNLLLLPEKALFWEEEKGLIISDVHLGKAGHFRKMELLCLSPQMMKI